MIDLLGNFDHPDSNLSTAYRCIGASSLRWANEMKNPMDKDRLKKDCEGFNEWMESELGISNAFFERLKSDDDWAYVVKLHALIEASLNHLLTYKFGATEVSNIISRLDISDKSKGKMAFISALDLLPKSSRQFITIFSTLRNDLVHDARNFDFSIEKWLASRNKDQRANFVAGASSGFLPEVEIENEIISPEEATRQYPRYAIFMASIVVLTRTYQILLIDEYNERVDRSMISLAESIYEENGKVAPNKIPYPKKQNTKAQPAAGGNG